LSDKLVPIAKKKPGGANQPGLSRLKALTREAAPRWSKNTGWSNCVPSKKKRPQEGVPRPFRRNTPRLEE